MEKLNIMIDKSYFPESDQGGGSSDNELQSDLAVLNDILEQAKDKKCELKNIERKVEAQFDNSLYGNEELTELHLEVINALDKLDIVVENIEAKIFDVECELIDGAPLMSDTASNTGNMIVEDTPNNEGGGNGSDSEFTFGTNLIEEAADEILEKRRKKRWYDI